jgi:hypothetical protein
MREKGKTMKKVSQTAKQVLDILTGGLDNFESRKVENSKSYTPVSVQHLGDTEIGPIFSVTHYNKQNGDLMADPDMTFLRGFDGNYYPGSFRNDHVGVNQECLWIDGSEVKFAPRLQKDLASFTTTWMRNIKHQQGLKVEKAALAA